MSKKVVVIGGGIIGLCSAYYLQKEGHEVTVIDKSDFTSGASYVNAGYLTPSHIISLAAPGMITKGIKWMFNSESPFFVKPRLDSEFLKWSLAFKKSANAKKVENSIPVIRDINLLSRDLYEDLKASKEFDFHYERKGLLMAYQTDKVGEAEWEVGERLIEAGLNAEMLTKEEIKKREPNANLNVKGGVFYDCDGHTTPSDFMPKMVEHLKNLGVEILAKEDTQKAKIGFTNKENEDLSIENDAGDINLKPKGNIKIDNAIPFQFKRFEVRNEFTSTGYSARDWNAGIVGLGVNIVDFQDEQGADIFRMEIGDDGNWEIRIFRDFSSTDGHNGSIDVMFVSKKMSTRIDWI